MNLQPDKAASPASIPGIPKTQKSTDKPSSRFTVLSILHQTARRSAGLLNETFSVVLTIGRLTDIIKLQKEGMSMTMQSLLRERQMSMYRLSQLSGVPKTTVIDICSGKSNIEGCTAKTVLQLSRALGCSMEELMQIDNAHYDEKTGLPRDETYLEKGLPAYLLESIAAMQASWAILDQDGTDLRWDIHWCDLNSDINYAETEQQISGAQAWYLRRKYLRMEKDDEV